MNPAEQPSVQDLARALTSVSELIKAIRQEQWTAPTPCSNWTVRELLVHVVGMNLVFTAIINEQEPPVRGVDPSVKTRPEPMHTRRPPCWPLLNARAYLNGSTGGRWDRLPERIGYRFASMIYSHTDGTLPRPPGNTPSCPKTSPRSHWHSLEPSLRGNHAPAGSTPSSPLQRMHQQSIGWQLSWAVASEAKPHPR